MTRAAFALFAVVVLAACGEAVLIYVACRAGPDIDAAGGPVVDGGAVGELEPAHGADVDADGVDLAELEPGDACALP